MSTEKRAQPGDEIEQEGAIAIRIPRRLDPTEGGALVWSSSEPKTDAEKAKLMNAILGQLPKLTSKINTTLKVKDVILQAVELTNKDTGEIGPGTRVILVTDKGEMYSSFSKGVYKSLGMLFGFWGSPPWKPAKPIRVVQLELSDNKRYVTLEYASATPASEEKKE